MYGVITMPLRVMLYRTDMRKSVKVLWYVPSSMSVPGCGRSPVLRRHQRHRQIDRDLVGQAVAHISEQHVGVDVPGVDGHGSRQMLLDVDALHRDRDRAFAFFRDPGLAAASGRRDERQQRSAMPAVPSR